MEAETDAGRVRIELALEVGADPIRGVISSSRGSTASFAGWLELVVALERARAPEAVGMRTADGEDADFVE